MVLVPGDIDTAATISDIFVDGVQAETAVPYSNYVFSSTAFTPGIHTVNWITNFNEDNNPELIGETKISYKITC
jgi:hypothetical protein